MQTIYRSLTDAPVERLKEIAEERAAWMQRAMDLQQKYNGRRVITQHDNLTGADLVVGLEDTGITPFGWSQYGKNKYLIPTRQAGERQEKSLMELATVGKSPEVLKIMCEEFDLPPYYVMDEQTFYAGFEVVDEKAYLLYNIYAQDAWEGNEHFERVKVWEYYKAKDM